MLTLTASTICHYWVYGFCPLWFGHMNPIVYDRGTKTIIGINFHMPALMLGNYFMKTIVGFSGSLINLKSYLRMKSVYLYTTLNLWRFLNIFVLNLSLFRCNWTRIIGRQRYIKVVTFLLLLFGFTFASESYFLQQCLYLRGDYDILSYSVIFFLADTLFAFLLLPMGY